MIGAHASGIGGSHGLLPTGPAVRVLVVGQVQKQRQGGFVSFDGADDLARNLVGGQRARRNNNGHRLAVRYCFEGFFEVIRARGAIAFVIPAAIAVRFELLGNFVRYAAVFLNVADKNLFWP